jgi:hypothetical protein
MQTKELDEQQTVAEWAEWSTGKYPELKLLYHITNEGKRSLANGAALKRAGLKKGVPDLCLPCAKGGYHALYIEMKKDKKCKPTKDQKEWLANLNAAGNLAVVCHSADEAIETLKRYLNLKEG